MHEVEVIKALKNRKGERRNVSEEMTWIENKGDIMEEDKSLCTRRRAPKGKLWLHHNTSISGHHGMMEMLRLMMRNIGARAYPHMC